MVKGTPGLLKIINKSSILSMIIKEKVISRAEISNRTDLSKSTVSSIIDELLNQNIILEKGEGISTKLGGRKPIELVINPEAGYIVGVDVGAYKSLCAISDFTGKILMKKKLFTSEDKNEEDLQIIINTVKEMIEESGVKSKIIGMGFGIPGTTDVEKGIALFVPKLKWKNLEIRKRLEHEFNLNVFIDNDVNMAILGEKWIGAGKDYDNFVFISIGDAIGSGIIIDNKLYRGSNYAAGEIGYLVLSRDALKTEKYTFDMYGYFESVASGSAVEKRTDISCKEVFERASKNDAEAMGIVDEITGYISMGISNVISILNPKAVILGGGLSKAGMRLLLPVKEKVSRLTPVNCTITLSELGDEAGVIGCIASVLENKYGISFY